MRGAHQDGDAVGRNRVDAAGAARERLDLLADPARLLLAVPVADQPDLLALRQLGPERLAEPAARCAAITPGGGGEDVRRRAVVLLEADHLRARKVLLEAQDVADLGAAPAVDRLVVVADAADVAVAAGEQPQPQVLRDVGVLVLVDQDVAEPALVAARARPGAPGRCATTCSSRSPKSQAFSVLQPLLVVGVELGCRGGRRRSTSDAGTRSGRQRAVLPAVDQAGEQARRPALLVDVLGLDDLPHQAELVVDVEDGEVRLQADELGVAAQDLAPRARGRCRARACPR